MANYLVSIPRYKNGTITLNSTCLSTMTASFWKESGRDEMNSEDAKSTLDTLSKVSNTVNVVRQTSDSNSSKISNLTTVLGVNSDGTTATNDIVHKVSELTQNLDGFEASVSSTYATKTQLNEGLSSANEYTDTEVTSAKAAIKVTTDNITTEVSKKTDKDYIISTINQSAESVKIQASRVEINGPAIFSSISNSVDNAISTQLAPVSTAASNASDAAATALQTALDGAFLTISSTNGILFKNGAESTILQVIIFPNGGTKCETIEQVRERFGSTAYIEWQWKHESTGEWGTLLSNDSHLSQGGMWLTVTPTDVATKTTFSASLVVPD